MVEQYKGYEIKVYWSDIEMGYVFCVFSKDGEGLKARETIDRLVEKEEMAAEG